MPVDPALLGAFIVAASALVLSPGPDTLLVLRYTLASGQRVGFATVSGVQLGLLVHAIAAVLGLSVLILSVPLALKAVAVAGAAYLAFLGLQSIRAGRLGLDELATGDGTVAVAVAVGGAKACRDAILCNILNPKVILLFIALMPNFVDPERGAVPLQFVMLAAVLIAINIFWQSSLVLAAGRARRWLARPTVQRWIAYVSGAILFGFAVLLVLEHVLATPPPGGGA